MTRPCEASPPDGRDSPGEVVLTLPTVVEPAVIAVLCQELEAILDDPTVGRATIDAGALRHPNLVALDALARLQLTARRRGRRLRLVRMSPALQDLLQLTGLYDTCVDPHPT